MENEETKHETQKQTSPKEGPPTLESFAKVQRNSNELSQMVQALEGQKEIFPVE